MGFFSTGTPRKKGSSFFSEDPYSTDQLQQQIDNAQLRIADSGYKTQDADQRNWFEKATNLKQGQNWFLDTLEILGRGGNAVRNVYDKRGKESAGTAFFRGLSGQEKVSGADLAEKAGVENKVGKFLLGTGIDIFSDPTTYIPGGVLLKGVKSSAGMAVKPLKTAVTAIEDASPALRTFKQTQIAPRLERAKDGLGYMFKPGYKQDETLFGEKSDFLQKLQQDTENSRRFKSGELMNTLTNTAKDLGLDKGVDVGRVMEKGIQADPKISSAAQTLMDQNAEMRQLAKDNGIDIPELANYMTHVWSKTEREQRGLLKPRNLDKGQFGTGNPNRNILSARKYEGSVEDINQQVGREMFEPNAFFASAAGQQRLNDYIHAVGFRRKVLSNPDFAVKYEKGMQIPANAEVIDTATYKFLKDEGDNLEGLVPAEQVGGKYVVTKAAKQLLDRYQRINTDEGTKAFIKAIGGIQGTWKKLALFSPGFHIRNVAGAGWNMYAAGMNPADIATFASKSVNDLAKFGKGAESPMYREFRQQGLASGGLTQSEYSSFFKEPEKVIEKQVQDKSKPLQKRLVSSVMPQNLFNTSRNIGEKSDEAMKYAMYQWAREKLKLEPSAAAAKVREALFDYSDLTPFEQKARMLVPFYTWSRKNIPFQVKKLLEDPRKFANLNKVRLNAQSAVGIDEQNQPDYMKENFAIPVYGSEGKGKMLGLNLPASDLTKLSNPLKLATDAITPLLKTPIELASNYNLFRGKPIQKFEGQEKQYQIPGTGIEFGIPVKTAYALEQATGQVGRNATEYLQKPDSVDQDNKFRVPSFGMSSVVKDFDTAKNAYFEKLQELKQLQDLMLYIQQQEGAKPRTVNEIKKGSR